MGGCFCKDKNGPRRLSGIWPESDMEEWENRSYAICERLLGDEKYKKRLTKIAQTHAPKIGDKTRLNMDYSKAKKTVGTSISYIKRCNGVGAVGYAAVTRDPRIPDNDFFRPGRRFRIRLRHTNLRSDDDAAASPREVAIKFADQNEDGPLDLILITGRTAPARNCKSFLNIMKIRTPEEIKQMCLKDPHFYFSLVDSLRRGPDSFTDLSYHSQIPYKLIPRDGRGRLVRFKLIPVGRRRETGLLDEQEQENPWEVLGRRALDVRSPNYLRAEFLKRIETEPIDYILQIQVMNCEDPNMWNPQELWDEDKHPWMDLANIKLTTALTCTALNRTYFNIVDKPVCLKFPQTTSSYDYKSYHHVMCEMYTKFEIKHMRHSDWGKTGGCNHPKVQHIVTVCAGPVKETRPRVDVFLTITGTQGRTTPRRLNCHFDGEGFEHSQEIEHYEVNTEPVGELLAVTIAVRHRHLTDDWYLRYVVLSNPDKSMVKHFPCHSVVLAKVTLRTGDVSLPQYDCHEVLCQERMLEIRDRQHDYHWQRMDGLPSQIRGNGVKDISANEQLQAEKFTIVPWEVDHALGDVLLSLTALKSSTHQMSLTSTHRQTSYDSATRKNSAHTNSYNRQNSAPAAVQNAVKRKSNPRARMRWTKLKLAISFIAKVKLPDGPKGEICRTVQDDLDFGRMFLHGSNPTILKRCCIIPENFPVKDEDVQILLDRGQSLSQEALNGHIYIADYKFLRDVPSFHQDADHRFMVAPMCLFYTRASGQLTPIAIQLSQEPGIIWTPKEACPEDWLLAKLWVRCADFNMQFVVSHLLKTHFLIEPFAIATMRQLSVSHPVYKLLKPHFRYTIPMNTLIRTNIMKKGGALDKWTSLGCEGAKALMKSYMLNFTFEEMDMNMDLEARGVNDPEKLPNYLYRDDGVRLWGAIALYCEEILAMFYKSEDDVINDTEIQSWTHDLHENGFPTLSEEQRKGLPRSFTSMSELSRVVTKVIFNSTCFHSATHQDALDLYGFLPMVPAMMRQLPPHKRGQTNREFLTKTLPEQSPEAYYGSLANVLQQCKPDEKALGNNYETYFVEDEVMNIQHEFRRELHSLSRNISARNASLGVTYDSMCPSHIPNAVEPVPFLPQSMTENMGAMPQFDKANLPNMFTMGPSVPLMTLPICMQFSRNMGGKSFIGRRMSANLFSRAMGGVGLDKVNVPLNAMDRKRFSVSRYQYNKAQMNMYNTMYDGEICRTVQDDGRMFLHGSNPTILKRCCIFPENFPVKDEDVQILLDRGQSLSQEALNGHIYIADYKFLRDVPSFHQDADHRFMVAPMCLFYTRASGQLTPIAIQLSQEPGIIWTPKEACPEDWLLAKLWVRCADFNMQFVVSHLLKTHFLIEPFAIATMRQLSVSHPVYKLLKPHFRYTIPMNTLIRTNIMKKGGALDKWTSLGCEGAKALMKSYMLNFTFEEMDMNMDLEARGVNDPEKLPNYLYRDDGVRLWGAIALYCEEILAMFYKSEDDVINDTEIQSWTHDLHENGFPTLSEEQRKGLPRSFTSMSELSRVVTKVIFNSTCFHSATHQDALDLYGFLPMVPAMMRQLPPHKRGQTNREFLTKTLPEQSPEAYYGSLANVLQQCKPDEKALGNNYETYFVEDEVMNIQHEFRRELHSLSRNISARNASLGVTYDSMCPSHIPNAVEPVPFLPQSMTENMGAMPQFDKANLPNMFTMGPSVPLMTLPICMQFSRNMGGKSFIGRRMSANLFSRAMGGVGLDKVNVPLNAMDRKRFSVSRYQYNKAQMNMYNTMYDGMY